MAFYYVGGVASQPSLTPPGTGDTWTTFDADDYLTLPDNATGVQLRVTNIETASEVNIGWRKTGSSENYYRELRSNYYVYGWVGLNADKQFDFYWGNDSGLTVSNLLVKISAYSTTGTTFLDTKVNKSYDGSSTWNTIDCSAQTVSGTRGILFDSMPVYEGSYTYFGLRHPSSTDTIYQTGTQYMSSYVTACDSNRCIQMYDMITNRLRILLSGYVTSGASFYTNLVDVTPSYAGLYRDLTALPEGATGGFYVVVPNGNNVWLRMKGDTYDGYLNYDVQNTLQAMYIGADASGIVQARIEDTDVKIYLAGYSTTDSGFIPRPSCGIGGSMIL